MTVDVPRLIHAVLGWYRRSDPVDRPAVSREPEIRLIEQRQHEIRAELLRLDASIQRREDA